MIKNFEQLKEMLKAMPVKRKVAVVPAQDEHTLEAISHAYRDGMVEPVLIGDEPKIREILAQIGTDADKMTIIHVEDPTEAIQKAADMARDGEVDCIMKGKTETGALMKVLVNRERGIRKNDTMSLLAFMESPNYHKVFAITDVGLLTYPSKDQKKAAIQNAVEAFHALGVEPVSYTHLDNIPVSDFTDLPDGTMPQGTSKYEKRGIAVNIPVWDSEKCIQCNICLLYTSKASRISLERSSLASSVCFNVIPSFTYY